MKKINRLVYEMPDGSRLEIPEGNEKWRLVVKGDNGLGLIKYTEEAETKVVMELPPSRLVT